MVSGRGLFTMPSNLMGFLLDQESYLYDIPDEKLPTNALQPIPHKAYFGDATWLRAILVSPVP